MSARTNRRQFLKAASAAGVGFWAGGLPALGQNRSANDKINVAVVGCGGKGASHVGPAAGQNLVALCDVDEQRAAKAFAAHPGARKYHDFRKMLDEMGKQIDAVIVSTPDHTHAPASVMAMRLGKHVYCEKPLARDVHECRVMAKAARDAKVSTQMGNQGHSGAAYRQMVEIVRSGAIGKVREAHAWCPKNFSATARPKDMPEAPATLKWDLWLGPAPYRPYHPSYVPFEWRAWWDFGTGGLGDMACHIIDPIFTALDLKYPTSVEAQGEPKVNPEGFAKDLTVKYEFPGLTLYWHHGDNNVPTKRPIAGLDLPKDLKLPGTGTVMIGDKGVLIGAHGGGFVALLPREKFADYKLPQVKGMSHHDDWFEAIRGGRPAGSNFEYAARLTETVLLGNVSWRVGKRLEWDASLGKATNCPEADAVLRREYRKGWTL
jgi:predicted dehydrogenase